MLSKALPVLVTLFAVALAQETSPPIDTSGCIVAKCVTLQQINTLWCHTEPEFYCQCVPVDRYEWSVMVRPCAPQTEFNFRFQKCGHQGGHDRDACWDDGGSGSGSGSGDDWSDLSETPMGIDFSDLKDDDQLLEDDAMEFLIARRRS
ncbi:uncharacterized protein LOC131438808 [Malaya genurostris]|uniref:uncharacterized protein LOC131438808 n=1 Tax=Malaya genurostris TaxID=325434 RepID=UPI0026F3809B|nr:uncharacterized protein LOC131438808 [Malaya genurostris]